MPKDGLRSKEHALRTTGANVAAAVRVAERLGPGATVATIVVDSGLRYLRTDLFRS